MKRCVGWSGLVWTASLIWAVAAHAAEPAFTARPTVSKNGDNTAIAFAVSAATDAEVAVLDSTGKVVRHLAAGMLGGANPPPEPLKAGLEQSIAWDGKDDFAKPAGGAPFSVRVRLGLGAKFGRFIGEDPYILGEIDALIVGDDGNLYVEGYVGPANENQKTIRVFSPEGRFLRTVLPFPANLPPDAMKDVARWDDAAKAWHPRNLNILNPEFIANNNASSDYRMVSVSKERGITLVGTHDIYRLDLQGGVSGETIRVKGQSPWPIFDRKSAENDHYGHPLQYHDGPLLFNASPDGKYLFLSGPFPNKESRKRVTAEFPFAAVFRQKLDGSDEMKLFAAIPATWEGPWSTKGGSNYGRTGPVHGVCADSKNNVYICDREKDRVAVFDEAGKPIGEIAVKNPDMVAVHPRTGAIYVIRRFCNGWGTHSMILDKFDNFAKEARPSASFNKFHHNNSPKFAVTCSGDKTILWLAGVATDDTKLAQSEMPKGLFALEDTGKEFQVMPRKYGPKTGAQLDFARITTDPGREEVYISNGENLLYRYNGDNGEGGLLTRDGSPFYGADLCVGYDGLIYVRGGDGFSGPLERVTHELKPAPFPAIESNVLYPIYGRFGIGFCEKGAGVGPDGKVYDCWMYDFSKYFVSGWGPDGLPLKGKYMADRLKTSKPVRNDVKMPEDHKVDSAIIGPVCAENGGIRVDLKGNIYVGLGLLPGDYQPPAGFEKAPDYVGMSGSVVKFSPDGGAVLRASDKDAQSQQPNAPRIQTNFKDTVIEGALAMYPGVAPFSGARYGGNTSCCVCRVGRFDLDRFGRLVLPNAVGTSVRIVDNAGNLLCAIGQYGNFDSQYVPTDAKDGKPLISSPAIPLAWPTGAGFTEKAVYICDTYNRRVVRADFTWKAEATVPVK